MHKQLIVLSSFLCLACSLEKGRSRLSNVENVNSSPIIMIHSNKKSTVQDLLAFGFVDSKGTSRIWMAGLPNFSGAGSVHHEASTMLRRPGIVAETVHVEKKAPALPKDNAPIVLMDSRIESTEYLNDHFAGLNEYSSALHNSSERFVEDELLPATGSSLLALNDAINDAYSSTASEVSTVGDEHSANTEQAVKRSSEAALTLEVTQQSKALGYAIQHRNVDMYRKTYSILRLMIKTPGVGQAAQREIDRWHLGGFLSGCPLDKATSALFNMIHSPSIANPLREERLVVNIINLMSATSADHTPLIAGLMLISLGLGDDQEISLDPELVLRKIENKETSWIVGEISRVRQAKGLDGQSNMDNISSEIEKIKALASTRGNESL